MQYFKDILGLFFPKICACCEVVLVRGEYEICLDCIIDLPITNFSNEPNNAMEQVFYGRIPIQFGASILYYQPQGKSQALIYALKYQGRQKIGNFLANLLFNQLQESSRFPSIDLIVPVPLHKRKLKKRGYNQLTTFGKCLSQHLKIPFSDKILFRTKSSHTQTKKNRQERHRNLDHKFFLSNYSNIDHMHILLIDDVLTTGATLEACALALLERPVKISILTMAFTD